MIKKDYKIAPYMSGVAMYESDDFRLKEMKESNIISGTYKRDKSVKGMYNGGEIGIFTAADDSKYIIFVDHSAKKI